MGSRASNKFGTLKREYELIRRARLNTRSDEARDAELRERSFVQQRLECRKCVSLIGTGHRVSIFELIKLRRSYLCIGYPIRTDKHMCFEHVLG